ncbi:Alstrom syndrome protein 1 homolog a isoform X2 [Drosophila willistoni]|uniref:Alstrom syndrome protein 1 homolog a isoform X2 n=1 Tax=Drosophila willistoni TaxID=7260 RepID=UPI000C26D341|nr:Alstrom syndrome protein 1 homolog a isoform X2 [Drosophila willistoni]
MSHQHNRQRKQDMDEEPRSSTSRVPPKVREYISEMAVDRELERYMALSSTASSGGSGHSCALVMGAAGRPGSSLCPRNRCRSGSSRQSSRKSLSSCLLDVAEPPQPPAGPAMLVDQPTSGSTDDVVLIPIVIAESGQVVVSKKQMSASVEDLCTPTKAANQPKEMQTKKTQTPESAVKSHKRLEWDPSADVGYYKRAVSTSNISTLERSVMEDCWRLPHQRSESDLNRLQLEDQKAEESQHQPQQQQQPPLASSTFVNRTISRNRNRESNTSSRRDSQVTVGTSLYGSSVASSFDYQQPSLQHEVSMTIATSSTTSTSVSATPSLTQRNSRQLEQERLFTAAQFQRILSENKENSNNNHNNRKKKEKPRGERENKENLQPGGSHRSSVSGSGELDLGIDLLCSLIKTRSLSHGQKKHLVREIAKRISCLESGDSSSRSSRQGRRESLPTPTPIVALTPASVPAAAQMKTQSTNTTSSVTKIQSKATNTTSSITKIQTIAPVPAPRTHLPTTRSSGESSTSCSHDLITQKTNVQAQSANSTDADVDTDQVALQDWLNPMTQSEIEYEQRAKRGPDTERRHQLVWIESEIKRLQTLHTLLATATTKLKPKAVCLSPLHIESAGRSTVITEQIIQTAPLVETPASLDSRATGGAERPPPAEGNNNLSQKKQPKETQTDEIQEIPAAPPVTPANTPLPPPQIPQRGARPCSALTPPPRPPPPPPPPPPERHLNHELQLQQQRSKMATPASSSGGGRSESVCSFVQQRQRQFMEHYQNQQQQQLYLLQQHHHQQQHQQQQPHNQFYYRHQQQPQCHHPHHNHHQHAAQVMEQQQRPISPYLQMQYGHAMGSTYATPYLGENAHSCGDDGAIYYQVVNSQGAASYVQATAVATGPAAATATASTHCRTTTTSSASSMLCISSEISIPMGMVNTCETTTTTTTTHQYDDVACQRRRQQPRPQTQSQSQPNHMPIERRQQTFTQTMQVRPRGIAYVIQFTVNGDSEVLPETLSLQDQLQRARPEFCAKSKQRKAILNQMQMLRNVRRREMDELLCENINTNVETVDKQLQQLPPPAASRIRIFSTKEMKALTSKRCQSLPEVLAAQNRMREEQRRRNNRMMRDVFNRRLHSRVAKGQLSLNHSRTII